MHKGSFIVHWSVFEGKYIILIALLCRDFKGFNTDSLEESRRVQV